MISILSPLQKLYHGHHFDVGWVFFQLWLPKLCNDDDQLAAAGHNTPHPDILAGLKSFVIVLILTIRVLFIGTSYPYKLGQVL